MNPGTKEKSRWGRALGVVSCECKSERDYPFVVLIEAAGVLASTGLRLLPQIYLGLGQARLLFCVFITFSLVYPQEKSRLAYI